MKIYITGGSRGIGLAIAQEVAQRGHTVVIAARSEENLKTALPQLPTQDGQKHSYEVLDLENIPASFEFDPSIDALINNAGLVYRGAFQDFSPEDTQRLLQVNLYAPIVLSQKFASQRVKHGKKGDLIFISSVLAVKPIAGTAVYSSTKGALNTLVKTLARELGPQGIKVNNIAPGATATQAAQGRASTLTEQLNAINKGDDVQPQNVAVAVTFLLDNPALTGSTITIDNGLSL